MSYFSHLRYLRYFKYLHYVTIGNYSVLRYVIMSRQYVLIQLWHGNCNYNNSDKYFDNLSDSKTSNTWGGGVNDSKLFELAKKKIIKLKKEKKRFNVTLLTTDTHNPGYIDANCNINFEENSNDFLFDNQILSQIFMAGYKIAEVTCPTKYFDDASSTNFVQSIRYGIGVLLVSFMHWFSQRKLMKFEIYQNKSK